MEIFLTKKTLFRGKRAGANSGEHRALKQCVVHLVARETLPKREGAIAAMNGLRGNTLSWTAVTEYARDVIQYAKQQTRYNNLRSNNNNNIRRMKLWQTKQSRKL